MAGATAFGDHYAVRGFPVDAVDPNRDDGAGSADTAVTLSQTTPDADSQGGEVLAAFRGGARVLVTTAESLGGTGVAAANLRLALAIIEQEVGTAAADGDLPVQITWFIDEYHNGVGFRDQIVRLGRTRARISGLNNQPRDQPFVGMVCVSATALPSDADALHTNIGISAGADVIEVNLNRAGHRCVGRQFPLSMSAVDMGLAMAKEAAMLSLLDDGGIGDDPDRDKGNDRAMIFVLTKDQARMLAAKISADAVLRAAYGQAVSYDAKMSAVERQQALAVWQAGEHRREDGSVDRVRILVSTTALAEGFDRPFVSLVIVVVPLGSVYRTQQAFGRAGRKANLKALCMWGWNIAACAPVAYYIKTGRDLALWLDAIRFCCVPMCRRKGLASRLGQALECACSGCDQCTVTLPLLAGTGVAGRVPIEATTATQNLLKMFVPGEPLSVSDILDVPPKRWCRGPWDADDRVLVDTLAQKILTHAVDTGLLDLRVHHVEAHPGKRHFQYTLPGEGGEVSSPIAAQVLLGKRAVVIAQRLPGDDRDSPAHDDAGSHPRG